MADKETSIPPLPKGYEDYGVANPSPLKLSPSLPALPLGYESYVPQTTSAEDVTKTVAPYAGRLAANSLPVVGSYFGPEGTVAGTAVANGLLKTPLPELFGQAPQGLGIPVEFGKDLALNNLIPDWIGKALGLTVPKIANLPGLRSLPGVREGAAKQMSREILGQYQQPESQILEWAAKDAEHLGNIGTGEFQPIKITPGESYQPLRKGKSYQPPTQSTVVPSGEIKVNVGEHEIGQELRLLAKDLEAGVPLYESPHSAGVAAKALQSPSSVASWKLAAGEKGIEGLAINRLISKGYNAEKEVLDAGKILEELGGKSAEIYSEAISKPVMREFRNVIGEIEAQQAGHGVADALVRWSKGHLLWNLAALTPYKSLSVIGMGAGGVQFSNAMLGRALRNPETAKLVVAAMRTPASAPQASLLQQALMKGLQFGEAGLETYLKDR